MLTLAIRNNRHQTARTAHELHQLRVADKQCNQQFQSDNHQRHIECNKRAIERREREGLEHISLQK